MSFHISQEEFHLVKNLVDLLGYRSVYQPDKRAFVFLKDGETEEEMITYRDLDRKAKVIAASLLSFTKPGERALLLYPPGLAYIEAFFGCLYAGLIAVPAYPPDPMRLDQTLPRLKTIIDDSSPSIALTVSYVAEMVQTLFSPESGFRELVILATDTLDDLAGDKPPFSSVSPEKVAFLQYTSGSTGSPKGVMISHGNLMHNMEMITTWYDIDSKNAYGVSWLPPYHDMGLIGGILQPVYIGVPVVHMSPLSFLQKPVRWLRAISRYQATVIAGPNFAYDLCVRKTTPQERSELNLNSLVMAVNGAEPIREDVLDRFSEAFASCGFRKELFSPAYGLAEGTLFCTGVSKSIYPDRLDSDNNRSGTAMSCGTGWGDQKVIVVDPESRITCQPGQEGEVWVSGSSVARGYWNRPDETIHTFEAFTSNTSEGPYLRTGDMGTLKDGALYITSRIKDLIIIRGKNHYPQDIERTVETSHPLLRPGCGAAFSVDMEGEELLVVAQEVKRNFNGETDADEVIRVIRQEVSQVHQLQVYAVYLLNTGIIPKTSSGKIQRHACKELFFENRFDLAAKWELVDRFNSTGFCADEKSLEDDDMWTPDTVCDALKETISRYTKISVSEIHKTNQLSVLGMDSLVLAEIQHEVAEFFDVELSLEHLAGDMTLDEISLTISKLANEQRALNLNEEDLLENLDALSEEEIDQLLAEMPLL